MPANGGYRVFNTGDVLTAAQVQYYLQNQTVMYFATTTARDAVLTGATLVEGMVSYTPSTGLVVYNGSAWVSAGTASPLTTKGDVWGYSTTNARVPVGSDGQVLTADSTQALGVKWATASSGAVNWTLRRNPTGNQITQIATNGSNIYVSGATAGELYSSSDAKTWTARTSGFGANDINSIGYGNGLFVAVGANGTLTTSTDGITWTARTSNAGTNALNAVLYANSLWIAVGSGSTTPVIITSTDGITWTARTAATSGAAANAIAYGGGYWVITTNLSTNNYQYSTNGTTWTAGVVGSGNLGYVFYANSTWYMSIGSAATPSVTYINTSTPNTTWAQTANNSNFPNAVFSNGQVYSNQIYWCASGNTSQAGLGMPTLNIFNGTITNNGGNIYMNGFSGPVLTPSLRNTLITSLLVTSGGYVIGDQNGRIYTSF